MASEMMRHVRCENREISYLLEQKPVKNLNLRIHKDGRVFLSAIRIYGFFCGRSNFQAQTTPQKIEGFSTDILFGLGRISSNFSKLILCGKDIGGFAQNKRIDL